MLYCCIEHTQEANKLQVYRICIQTDRHDKHKFITTLSPTGHTYLAWGSTMIKKVVPLG